jgi:hypothetical protein
MRTSFHHQPEAQHPIFQLSTSWQADYPIFGRRSTPKADERTEVSLSPLCAKSGLMQWQNATALSFP